MKRNAAAGIRSLLCLLVCMGVALGGLPGLASSAQADEAVYYLYNDHLGTPVKATDEAGAVVWAADALPFGAAAPTTETLPVNLRFPGQYHDAETALHYNYQRTYHPGLRRYLEPDPLGQWDSANVYPYAGSSPVNVTDPTGQFWDTLLDAGSSDWICTTSTSETSASGKRTSLPCS